MPSQANLIFGVQFNNCPEEVRTAVSEEYFEDFSQFGLPSPSEVRAFGENVYFQAREEGLVLFGENKNASMRLWFHVSIGEIDESEEQGVLGIALTSRYAPTLADDNDHGGLWPIAFDERMRRIQEIFETGAREALPSFWALKPIWIVKEDWY